MSRLFVYSVFNSVTGDFLASVQYPSLEQCRSFKRTLSSSLGLPPSGVYGRYHTITC